MHYLTALVQLPLVRERPTRQIRTPEDVYQVCLDIADLAQETFHVLCMDQKNGLLDRQLVTLGLVNSTATHGREVFRPAILSGASSVALVHNHPTGDPTPSADDLRVTRQLIEAGRILDIPVVDHVIVGRPREGQPSYVSLRESGLCAFSA